jgi:hypothetical protein
MATRQNGRTIKDGLIFHFDTGDIYNSYLGRPTNNTGYNETLYNYNNVGGSVTTVLTQTSDTYRGAPIWKQTLTPLDGSGVSWLSNANNPGLGVVLYGGAAGGGLANRYTGHSIFFKPTVPMSSVPIYLHYSNIGGWQSCCDQPEDMGDGWFRARVLWYDTTTRSDGKYWAINPLSASLNVPITIFWAGPFKEDLNVQSISQYVYGTRSATQGLKDLTGVHTLDLSNVSFNNATRPQMYFDGTNDYINIASSNLFDTSAVTVEVLVKPYASSQYGFWFEKGAVNTQYSLFMEGSNIVWRTCSAPGVYDSMYFPSSLLTANQWHHVVGTYTPGVKRVYHNSYLKNDSSYSSALTTNQGNQFIGSYNSGAYYYNGEIAIVKVYNRVLTAEEVHKNYLHYKERFSLPNVSPSIATNSLGNSATSAAPSARLLKEMGYTTNGNYWLQPPGVSPFLAYVEFDSNGGDPWVHVGTIADEDDPSNNPTYHVWSDNMNSAQSCPPWDNDELFGDITYAFVSDYKNAGWSSMKFSQIMIRDSGNTKRKLLHTNEGQIKSNNSSLSAWFGSLKWDALGSDTSNSAFSGKRVTALDITNYGVNDPVLQSSSKSKLLFKYGEKDGVQDGNKDRSMISWHRHDAGDGVDGPTGLGCFTNRGGTIDYRDIIPGSSYPANQDFPPSNIGGSYYYSIWIR